MEVPGIALGDGGLYIRVEEGPGGEHEGQDTEIGPRLPGQHVHDRAVAPVADQEDQFFKAVAGQAGRDVVEHVIVGVRLEADGPAEIQVLDGEADRDRREDQQGVVRVDLLKLRPDIFGHGARDHGVGSKRGLAAVLLGRPQRDHDDGLFLIDPFHFKACQVTVVLDHVGVPPVKI